MAMKQIIIDTDAGLDDTQAILMALNCPNVEVVAITTCHGNVDVAQINLNVLRVLKVAGRLDIPVYSGCAKSIIGGRETSSHYHGQDGLGDAPDPLAPGPEHIQKEHAVPALIRMVNANPGKLTIACLAPLTNLAMAIRMDPSFSSKVQSCFIMGGNMEGKGNITNSAEFNFFTDPEAADIVLREMTCQVTVVGWETCLRSSLDWAWYKEYISQNTPKADFLRTIESKTVAQYYKSDVSLMDGVTAYSPADQVLMAVCLHSGIILDQVECLASVCLHGSSTRGQMVADVRSHAINQARQENRTTAVLSLDNDLFAQILMSSLMTRSDAEDFWRSLGH